MTEAQTYERCMEVMAKTCADNAAICEKLKEIEFPQELIRAAENVHQISQDVLAKLVSLRLSVI